MKTSFVILVGLFIAGCQIGIAGAAISSGTFTMGKKNNRCSSNRRILTASMCKNAASELGLRWAFAWREPKKIHGCIFANDAQRSVYFNVDLKVTGVLPEYNEICIVTYIKLADGDRCLPNRRIQTMWNCRMAASVLGFRWARRTWNGPTDVGGCIFANDGRSSVYFNTDLGATGSNSRYAEICIGSYKKLDAFGKCSSIGKIKRTSTCWHAAIELGLRYAHTWTRTTDVWGCTFDDSQRLVYFNRDLGATSFNPRYADVCKVTNDIVDISGKWINNLGSHVTFKQDGLTLSGEYSTAVSRRPLQETKFPLNGNIGTGSPTSIGFVVTYQGEKEADKSTCAWSGQYRIVDGEPKIYTAWMLTKAVGDDSKMWHSRTVGKDEFWRDEN